MENDLISIIVPIYNVEKYLIRCIDSLINQTYQNIEIILIDDGSTDYSGKIADDFVEKDLRIKVFHKKNGGLSDARNYGIKKATGKYINFIDSDDYVDKKFIETLYKMIVKYNCKISSVGYQEFKDIKEVYIKNVINEKEEVFSKKEAIEYLYDDTKYCNYAWNKLYLKELFNDVEYPFNRKMEDLGTTYLLFDKCEIVAYNSIPLYFYFQRNDSILHKVDEQFLIDKFTLISERYNYIKNKYPDIYVNYINYFYGILEAFPYISKQEKEIAIKELNKIWSKIRYNCNFKLKLKFILINYFSKLYERLLKNERLFKK